MKARKEEYKKFREIMEKLPKLQKKIIFNTLRQMERTKKDIQKFEAEIIYEAARIKRKKLKISKRKWYEKINSIMNYPMNQFTFDSMVKRKSTSTEGFREALEVLELDKEFLDLSYTEQLHHCISRSVDMFWLFCTLSDKDRKAIYYLAYATYMSVNHPEVFEESDLEEYQKWKW